MKKTVLFLILGAVAWVGPNPLTGGVTPAHAQACKFSSKTELANYLRSRNYTNNWQGTVTRMKFGGSGERITLTLRRNGGAAKNVSARVLSNDKIRYTNESGRRLKLRLTTDCKLQFNNGHIVVGFNFDVPFTHYSVSSVG